VTGEVYEFLADQRVDRSIGDARPLIEQARYVAFWAQADIAKVISRARFDAKKRPSLRPKLKRRVTIRQAVPRLPLLA
jgi:hypothetical protein